MTDKIPRVSIIIRRESIFQSVVCDTYSFIILGALFYFNYKFINGSYFVNFLIIILIILRLCATTKSDTVRIFKSVSDKKINKILKIVGEKND
tara:strand:+ start:107 stop:385 length:279 start_codon:yes stop_codon:yes gene_type:complete